MMMKAFIESQFSYCPLMWMLYSQTVSNKINRLHERDLRKTLLRFQMILMNFFRVSQLRFTNF